MKMSLISPSYASSYEDISCSYVMYSIRGEAFACAFATTILYGGHPGLAMYDVQNMRQHVHDTIQMDCLEPFLVTRRLSCREIKEGLEYGRHGPRVCASFEVFP